MVHKNFCSNNCEFAKKLQLLSYTAKYGDNYIDADYLWRCTKIDQIITTDSAIVKLGCATYSPAQTGTFDPCGKACPECPSECRVEVPHPLGEIVQVASDIEKLEDQMAAIRADADKTAYVSIITPEQAEHANQPPVGRYPPPGTFKEPAAAAVPVVEDQQPVYTEKVVPVGELPIHQVIVEKPVKPVEVPVVKERKKPGRKPKVPAPAVTIETPPEKKPEVVPEHGRLVEPSHTEPAEEHEDKYD